MKNLRRSRNRILLLMAVGFSGVFPPGDKAWAQG